MKPKEVRGHSGPDTKLSVGDHIPDVVFKDLTGNTSSIAKLGNKIQVVSFANRESGLKLRGWLRSAGLQVARDFPELDVVHLGFADVSRIPKLLRKAIKPLLRTIHDVSRTELESAYGTSDVLYLTPDWDGRYLEQFGFKDAEYYTCWIVQDGVIVEEFNQNTPESAKRFLSLFGKLAEQKSDPRPN